MSGLSEQFRAELENMSFREMVREYPDEFRGLADKADDELQSWMLSILNEETNGGDSDA